MHTLIVNGEPADKGHPASEFLHDLGLLTQRSLVLAGDVINDPVKDRLAELQEVNKATANMRRLLRQYLRDQISLDEMIVAADAICRERLPAEAAVLPTERTVL
jgi:hypothetical protein